MSGSVSGARRFLVKGRVQGVFFRASSRKVAESLGLRGSAINLPDGTVEVFACGSADALDELERWLQQGPPAAHVAAVEATDAEQRELEGFTTG